MGEPKWSGHHGNNMGISSEYMDIGYYGIELGIFFVDVVGDRVEDWKLEPSMCCFCKMSFP